MRIEFTARKREVCFPLIALDEVSELIWSSIFCVHVGEESSCLFYLYVDLNRCCKVPQLVTVDDVDSINLMNGYHDAKSVFLPEIVFFMQKFALAKSFQAAVSRDGTMAQSPSLKACKDLRSKQRDQRLQCAKGEGIVTRRCIAVLSS